MCSPQALFALQATKAVTSTLGALRDADLTDEVSLANIQNITRSAAESLKNISEQVQDTRGEIIKNLDRSLSRISVTAVETGFEGKTLERVKKGAVAKTQLDLNALRRNRNFAIKRLNANFQQNVIKQNLNIIEAGARKDAAILSGVISLGAAGIGLKTKEDVQDKIIKQRELAGKK